jgi:hypothetical protein
MTSLSVICPTVSRISAHTSRLTSTTAKISTRTYATAKKGGGNDTAAAAMRTKSQLFTRLLYDGIVKLKSQIFPIQVVDSREPRIMTVFQ